MSCVLRITGTKKLDVDKFQKALKLTPYKIDRVGEPIIKDRPDRGTHKRPGLSFDISRADFSDLQKQIKDAIKFLSKHESRLKLLKSNKTVTEAVLDFGTESRLVENVICQYDRFPAQLLKLAGQLNIDIELSQYPNSNDDKTVKTSKRKPKR